MNDFLSALKADLVDRRMRLPLLIGLIALVAGVGYALTSGSGTSAPPAAPSASTAGASATVPSASAGASANATQAAVAETTFGSSKQVGKLSNPFRTLASTAAATGKAAKGKSNSAGAAKPSSTTSTSSSSHSSPTPTSSSSGGSGHQEGAKPKPTRQPTTRYEATIELGRAPAIPGEVAHLVAFAHLKVGSALPSKKNPLIVIKALSLSGAKPSATLALAQSRAPIVSGEGACRPSSTECEALQLKVGQSEELQYLEPSGQTVGYLLKLTAVEKLR
jgi:hypothetical protein